MFWPLSFLPEFLIAFYFKGFSHGNIILFLMVLVWALRLSLYLGLRAIGLKEDFRYTEFSKTWPKKNLNFQIFLRLVFTQFSASVLMSSCFYVYLFSPSFGWSAPFWNVPLLGLFILGLSLEIVADEQIRSFKKKNFKENPKENLQSNVTFTGGVWKYVKYPNYAGEILIWLSFGLLSLPFTYGTLGLISPLAIFCFLTYVTGIPYLEKHRAQRKAEPYQRPKKNYIPKVF